MKEELEQLIGGPVEVPKDLAHADYVSNAALILGKQTGEDPKALAEQMVAKLQSGKHPMFAKIEVAGPGFINFYLAPQVFADEIKKVLEEKENYGQNENLMGKKVLIEHTNLNPFKLFHIGHLVNHAVGESISRLLENGGAEVKRVSYGGDVGLHVARAIYGMRLEENNFPPESASVTDKAQFLGQAYVAGATIPEVGKENYEQGLKDLNKLIYDRSNATVNKLYDWGKQVSLEYFAQVYKLLGVQFSYQFFESEMAPIGLAVVKEFLPKGVFEESEGAIVFKGEPYGLHTRVFVNSQGLPTYETKELGLIKKKAEVYPFDLSIVVTANEQNDYFKVMLKVAELIFPDSAGKMQHISHGFLRLPTGKMSSRTGDVITGESLIAEAMKMREDVTEEIAVGAIKYSILKQSPGKDIIFDFDKSLSFEGDSGPYLQYTYVRAMSVLAKAGHTTPASGHPSLTKEGAGEVTEVERLLIHFSEVVARAGQEFAPNYVVTYLVQLASAFNSYYAQNKIIGGDNEAYKLALTVAVAQVLKNGLWLLGITVPERM